MTQRTLCIPIVVTAFLLIGVVAHAQGTKHVTVLKPVPAVSYETPLFTPNLDCWAGHCFSPLIGSNQKVCNGTDFLWGDTGNVFDDEFRAWAKWDTTPFRRDCNIQILDLFLRIDIMDAGTMQTGHTTQVRRLTSDPVAASAIDLWNILGDQVYTSWVTVAEYAYRQLGPVAATDFENLLYTQDWFAVAITEDGDNNGSAQGLGYDSVHPPELLVVWECGDGTPAESNTWGAIKSLYR